MIRRVAAALVLVLAACSPAPATPVAPITIHSDQSTLHTLPAGTYSVAWTSDCSSFFLEWAPTSASGTNVEVPVDDPRSGSATITIPGGQAYLNGGGICDTGWSATITPR